jgi:hypothetical protein
LLLQSLDRVAVEVPDAPEDVHAIRRRMEDVARTWQLLTRLHTGEDRRAIVVSIEEDVSVLNFAERVLPRASDLWIQASLEQRQRLQRLFFPEGVAFSGKSFDRTVVTSSLFEYLRPLDGSKENLVDLTGIEPVTS